MQKLTKPRQDNPRLDDFVNPLISLQVAYLVKRCKNKAPLPLWFRANAVLGPQVLKGDWVPCAQVWLPAGLERSFLMLCIGFPFPRREIHEKSVRGNRSRRQDPQHRNLEHSVDGSPTAEETRNRCG